MTREWRDRDRDQGRLVERMIVVLHPTQEIASRAMVLPVGNRQMPDLVVLAEWKVAAPLAEMVEFLNMIEVKADGGWACVPRYLIPKAGRCLVHSSLSQIPFGPLVVSWI